MSNSETQEFLLREALRIKTIFETKMKRPSGYLYDAVEDALTGGGVDEFTECAILGFIAGEELSK